MEKWRAGQIGSRSRHHFEKLKPPFTSLVSKDNRRYSSPPYAAASYFNRQAGGLIRETT